MAKGPLNAAPPGTWTPAQPILLGGGLFASTSALGTAAGFWSSATLSSIKQCVTPETAFSGATWLILLLTIAVGVNSITTSRRPDLRRAAVISDLALGICSTIAALIGGAFYAVLDGRATALPQAFWLIAPTLLYFTGRAPSYVWSGPGWRSITLRSLIALLAATIIVGAILWSIRSPLCPATSNCPALGVWDEPSWHET